MRSEARDSAAKPEVVIRPWTRWAAACNAVPIPTPRIAIEDTILLAGTPRSGTTWVGQMLAAAEGHSLVNEPLGLKMPGVQGAGFSWATYVDPDEEWPQGESVLRRYFQGRGMTVKLLLRNGLRASTQRSLIVKEVKANRLLPWIARRFSLRGMIHLIRHPCAVVSSQMANLPDRDPCLADNLKYLQRELPHLLPWARKLATEWENRALTWALDQRVPLSAPDPKPWLTVSYERLVTAGERELERVFSACGVPLSASARMALEQNSWQVRTPSVDHSIASVEERLGVWKKRLRPEQIAATLEVCERCGVHIYGGSVMPHLD
jgi:hypothetical protein